MEEYSIRKCRQDDAEDVYRIVQDTVKTIYPRFYPSGVVDFFCGHHSKENIMQDIQNGNVSILMANARIVGTGSHEGNHITRVFVLPEFQGRGYGSLIMQYLEDEIARQYSAVRLDASLPASRLYEHRGYRTISHERIAAGNGAVLVYEVMGKSLEQGGQ